jgi:ferritin
MLKPNVAQKLNEQIGLEFYTANLYLQMSAWCSLKGFEGCAEFLRQHSEEERGHMQRLFDYVSKTGSLPILSAIQAPPSEWDSPIAIFKAIFEHECGVTKEINALVKIAFDEGDYSTYHFLQWYVGEQHEEENLFRIILDKFQILSTETKGLFFVDQELKRIAQSRNH